MFEEAITIAFIIGGCAAAVWYAKNQFQPEIERNMEKSDRPAVGIEEFVHKKHKGL